MRARVLVEQTEVKNTYRISVDGNIWYDYLVKSRVFEAMEETQMELGNMDMECEFEIRF